jgi:hypothetical protein
MFRDKAERHEIESRAVDYRQPDRTGLYPSAQPKTDHLIRESPQFVARFLEFAQKIKNSTRPRITRQSLDPWLDQVVLPMVIHSFEGGKTHTCPGMAGRKDQLSLS